MRRFIYILRRIRGFNYKNMFMIANKIAKISHKNVMIIILDMITCMLRYGAGYMDYYEFEFYLLNNHQRSTYLTIEMNNRIIANYNDKYEMLKFKDKSRFNYIFKDYIKREYLDLNINDKQALKLFLKDKNIIVAKKPCSMGGKGIKFIGYQEFNDSLYDNLVNDGYTLVEEYIIQDEKMKQLYDGSVNSLRIISFIDDNNEVIILNSVIKIGNGSMVDNFSSGGMYAFVNEKGEVDTDAIDENGHLYHIHPISKTTIKGFEIPYYDEVIKMVKDAAKLVSKVRYVGWDVAISNDGPLILEGNEYSGVFQKKASINIDKKGLLPLYRKYMKL